MLILEKVTLFVCIYGLNSHSKCSLRVSWWKNTKNFPVQLFFCISNMKCLPKFPYSKKSVLLQKIPCYTAVTFILIFHPNFKLNIWVYVNLPIYKKLIHGNISLAFWKPRIFCLVIFWMRYKTFCTYKYLH